LQAIQEGLSHSYSHEKYNDYIYHAHARSEYGHKVLFNMCRSHMSRNKLTVRAYNQSVFNKSKTRSRSKVIKCIWRQANV